MFSNPDEFIDLENFLIPKQKQINVNSDIRTCEITDKETNTKYIANIFKKDIKEYPKEKLSEFINEFSFTSKFNHPAILKYIRYSPVDFEKNPRPVAITNLSRNETLYHAINSRIIDFTSIENETKKYIIIYGIASAMSYLHSHDIIHCNLCPENIYLDENYHPKLGGFYHSQFISDIPPKNSIDRFSKYKGNFKNFSPEIFYYKDYSKASDVYAFSILLYKIFRGTKPFYFKTFIDYISDIVIEKKRPSDDFEFANIPFYYKELIQKCWSDDPSERPTFDEIVCVLKTDMNLANNEEYQEYVKTVDESLKSFDVSQEFHLFDDIMKSSVQEVAFFQSNFELKNVKESSMHNSVFGQFNAITDKETGKKYIARCSELNIDLFSSNDINNLTQELSVISQINHPSIAKFFGYSPSDFDHEPKPTIVSEYLPYTLKDIHRIC